MGEESFESASGARHAKKLVAMMSALCIISATTAGSSMFLLTPRSSQSVYAEQSLHLGPSYTIWRNGSTCYAEDAYGLLWGEGSNASMIINNALSGLTSGRTWKEKILIVGNIEIANPLIVESYTILQLDGQITSKQCEHGFGEILQFQQLDWNELCRRGSRRRVHWRSIRRKQGK